MVEYVEVSAKEFCGGLHENTLLKGGGKGQSEQGQRETSQQGKQRCVQERNPKELEGENLERAKEGFILRWGDGDIFEDQEV